MEFLPDSGHAVPSESGETIGALQPVNLTFESSDLLLSLGQGTWRICNLIDRDHQTVNQQIRLKKGH